jgi:hypothetical protein
MSKNVLVLSVLGTTLKALLRAIRQKVEGDKH